MKRVSSIGKLGLD